MKYKEMKKRLRRMIYTEKTYSIFRISRISMRIRIFSALFLVISAMSYFSEEEFLYTSVVISYAIGLIFLGYIRGVFVAFIPITINITTQESFLQSNVYVGTSFFAILLFIIYRLYNRTFGQIYYTDICRYRKEGFLIEYDDALSAFIPINNFIKCLTIFINKTDEDNIFLNYKLISTAIAACARLGRKKGFIYAGFIASNEDMDISEDGYFKMFFYTTPSNEEITKEYIYKYFEKYAGFNVTTVIEEDSQWDIYLKELQPDVYERQEIYNENYLRYLENRHIDFERQYKLFYRFKLKQGEELSVFEEELKNLGYKTIPEYNSDMMWDDGSVMFVVYKSGKIGQYRINMMSRQVTEIASKYNAEFCDWIIGGEHEN